jgi:DNA-binding MarR family transcriptional regulator
VIGHAPTYTSPLRPSHDPQARRARPGCVPRITGKAERALGAILDRLLARTGTSFPQWTVLAVTAASGGTAGRDHLVGAIADGRIPESAVLTAIAELTAAHLLETGPKQDIRLTEAGQARYREIRAAIEEVTSRVFDFPAEDLATAGRVLTVVAGRASAELASL